MFLNVKAEMARTKTTLAILAADPRIDCTISTMSAKINGKSPILFKEAVAIKDILGCNMSLEELFEEA